MGSLGKNIQNDAMDCEIFLGTCVRIIDWDSVLERMSLVLCLDNVEVMWRK